MSFDLSQITSTAAEWKPQKILLYSVQGLGKTTFGATFEKPILLRTEDGAGAIDVQSFPLLGSFAEVEAALHALHEQQNDYKTVVLDTLDWLEPLVWAQTCATAEKPHQSIEDFGYGKGYLEADRWWRHLMGWFDALRLNRGMTLVLLAHSEVKQFVDPILDPYDRYQIRLNKRAFALWQEWADMVLFANYNTQTKIKDKGFKKGVVTQGAGIGERVIYTEERPAFLAKNRWGLPPSIFIGHDKSWAAFHQSLSDVTNNRYAVPTAQQNLNIQNKEEKSK